jgi:hypothetical protein
MTKWSANNGGFFTLKSFPVQLSRLWSLDDEFVGRSSTKLSSQKEKPTHQIFVINHPLPSDESLVAGRIFLDMGHSDIGRFVVA